LIEVYITYTLLDMMPIFIADDAMAILAAFNSPDVDIIGLTTIFGNVRTPQATANALVLRELAEREEARTPA
jgi:inosine-uridine nucleoside N-ribohydrolase